MKKTNCNFKSVILSIMIIFTSFHYCNGQATTANPTNTAFGGEYVGWSNLGFDLNFTMVGTQYMQLNQTFNPGFVGIGNSPGGTNFLVFPNFKLDVDQGDIFSRCWCFSPTTYPFPPFTF